MYSKVFAQHDLEIRPEHVPRGLGLPGPLPIHTECLARRVVADYILLLQSSNQKSQSVSPSRRRFIVLPLLRQRDWVRLLFVIQVENLLEGLPIFWGRAEVLHFPNEALSRDGIYPQPSPGG